MIARGMKPLEKGTARTLRIVTKAGKVRSPEKKYAARLRMLKRKGLNDVTFKRIMDLMEDRESSELDILLFLEKTKTDNLDTKERASMLKVMLDWHKMKHGTKEHNHKVATVILHLTPQEKEAEIIRLLS